ncbi:NAD-dependent epimerase/dehydratase family protein [uncultured Nisaea sp.]|uniref:NAD-dependent epimerase/dehydratase family protein n=1 Tax=uncultured Nisaea sp. TaxID=538215 RepID=UPI0030EF2755|tara:strand:- start:643 stop:1569 length:927 start_codon:yes stop_codon:yes gene_type:complete
MAGYLVTGGCGFIGRHLIAALLQAGHGVTVLDDLSSGDPAKLPSAARLEEGCVTDADKLARLAEDADGVFHLAAIASIAAAEANPDRAHAVNAGGAANAVAATTRNRVPLVLISSAAVYGDAGPGMVSETYPCRPLSAYGADKLQGEQHALKAAEKGLTATIVRPFNVYGPGQDAGSPYAGVISRFIAAALSGAPLRVDGDGSQSRDFIFIDDLIRLLTSAISQPRPGARIVNGCTGIATSVKTLAHEIGRICGGDIRIDPGPGRSGGVAHSLGDPARAAELFGFRAGVTLPDGLQRTLDWQQKAALQ